MKKLLSILSLTLVLTMLFSVPAFADDWETDPVETDFDTAVSITECKITNIVSKTYTGKAIHQSPVVKYNSKTLKKDTDYTLSYKKNIYVGTATVTIKGKGKFTGSVSKTFKINPKGTTLVSLSKPKTKQIKVKWNKSSYKITGYQLQYATNSKFNSSKKATVSKKSTTFKTLKNLKKNKKYYVRIRTYRVVDGKKYYSTWSKYKAVTTK